MAFIITTTGTQNEIILNDLGGRVLIHPITSYDLEEEYNIKELRNSDDLQQAITNGYITVINESSENIQDLSNFQPLTAAEIKQFYESNPNTNAFTDEFKNKVLTIREGVALIKTKQDLIDNSESYNNNVIKLKPNSSYIIEGLVDIGDDIIEVSEKSSISGFTSFIDGLNYNGTGDFIIGTDSTFEIKNLKLHAPNGNLFNVVNSTISFFNGNDLLLESCNTLGSFFGYDTISFKNCRYTNINNGLVVEGSEFFVLTGSIFEESCKNIYLSFIGGIDLIKITNNIFKIQGINSAVAISSEATVLDGEILNNTFSGDGQVLLNFTKKDPQWVIKSNTGLSDSEIFGYSTFNNNTTTTNFSNTTSYFKVQGVNATTLVERIDSASINNRHIFVGKNEPNLFVDITGKFKTSRKKNTILFIIAKNGTTILDEIEIYVDSKRVLTPFSISSSLTMVNGDFVELYARNLSGTNNITVSSMQFKTTD